MGGGGKKGKLFFPAVVLIFAFHDAIAADIFPEMKIQIQIPALQDELLLRLKEIVNQTDKKLVIKGIDNAFRGLLGTLRL